VCDGFIKSAYVTSGIGAPPMGVAPWQFWQLVASEVETAQGKTVPLPLPAAVSSAAAAGAAWLAAAPGCVPEGVLGTPVVVAAGPALRVAVAPGAWLVAAPPA
jgi:hypothetical protein